MINRIDFLSPPITLFHLERRTHTSKVGGSLVILMFMLCSLFIYLLVSEISTHKKMTTIFHKKFEFEAGLYSFNSSSIFHFIQIFSADSGGYFDKYDSKYIRAYISYVHSDFSPSSLNLYDHWVFDTCRKDIDDKNLEPYLFENIENFTNGVCIRYYFNSTEEKYYSIEDKGFSWPYLEHGTSQKKNIYLTTIIQKCSNDSIINKIFGRCPPQKEIDDYLSKYFAIYLYFTDMQVDPTNYNQPLQKYFEVVSSGIGNSKTFVENYLHFSPLRIRTDIGSIIGSSYIINSFLFDSNRKGTGLNNEEYFTIVKYYHLMQNTAQIYERKYNNIFDILSEIGGVVQFIFYIFYWINFSYNRYIIAYDTNNLFFTVRAENNGINGLKFDNLKRKTIINFPKSDNLIKKNINNFGYVIEDKKNIFDKLEKDNKIKYQNYFSSTNEDEKNKKTIDDKNSKKHIKLKREVNPRHHSYNHLLKEINNTNNFIIENFQKIIETDDNKTEINNKEKEKDEKDNSYENVFSIMRGNLSKIQHQKKDSIFIDSKLKSLKYFSYIDFLKSLMFKKEKESHNFIRIFRKHLLSEEHLFKSHIKILFLEKQHNFSGEENINALDCFNEL